MRSITKFSVIIAVAFASCTQSSEKDATTEMTHDIEAKEVAAQDMQFYGEKISADDAINTDQLLVALSDQDSIITKITAPIEATCKSKGCWMDVSLADGTSMKVTFKDYGFFVPKEGVEGKETIIQGQAKIVETDVETLKHYAKDAGKSQEEIDQITEPKEEIAFVATGVIIIE